MKNKYEDYSRKPPKFKNCQRILVECDNCNRLFWEGKSKYKKKKRHFCSMSCYSIFRKGLPFQEQNAYRGVRKKGETKQVYHRRYCQNHPENIKHLKARRYAGKKGAGVNTL